MFVGLVLGLLTAPRPGEIGAAVPDFEARDHRGAVRRLADWKDSRLVALVFLGVDCPLAKLYARRLNELQAEFGPRGLAIVGVNSNRHDGLRDVAGYVRRHEVRFPLLKDADCTVADLLGATRTPEVFLLDEKRVIRYRGRIDDQYVVGTQRSTPTRRDLAEAVRELLARKPVSQPRTKATGCIINRRDTPAERGAITYHRDVAPILQKRCLECHRPGQIGPFSLLTYRQAAAWSDTIAEVVSEGRMPPWHANPAHGKFANDPRLSEAEKRTLLDWISAGCPEGDSRDQPPPPVFSDDWSIPRPDVVISMPAVFTIPAEGVVDYQYFEVDPGFTEDKWVIAAEIRPGNRAVVHHCTVFLRPAGARDVQAIGQLGSYCLAATAPGTPALRLPPGMAKRIPARSKLVFVLHYTPIGTVQTDQTSLGLVFADKSAVQKEVATHLLYDLELRIPPGVREHVVEKSWRAPADVLLLAYFPHMHLRGKSFRYIAEYHDGRTEILLDVPRWDFNWQHRYVLAEPKRLPRGTIVRCLAVYDNSADNPSNPDPSVTVLAGKQSWDEMFNGYFEWALADQDLTQPLTVGRALQRWLATLSRPIFLVPTLGMVGLFLVLRHRRRRASSASK